MAAVRHLGFVWGIFGPPTVIGGLYYPAKFGCYDGCSSFYNMNISIFERLAGKCLFTPPKLFLGNLN